MVCHSAVRPLLWDMFTVQGFGIDHVGLLLTSSSHMVKQNKIRLFISNCVSEFINSR